MSRATMRFLLSRAFAAQPFELRNPHRKAVGVAQVHVLVPSRGIRAERRRVGARRSARAALRRRRLAPELECSPLVELDLPGAARGQAPAHEPRRRAAPALRRSARSAARSRVACRPAPTNTRQLAVGGAVEDLAVRVHQAAACPSARAARAPRASLPAGRATRGAPTRAHPGQLLRARRAAARGPARRNCRRCVARTTASISARVVCRSGCVSSTSRHREQRRAQHQRDSPPRRTRATAMPTSVPARRLSTRGLIPHARPPGSSRTGPRRRCRGARRHRHQAVVGHAGRVFTSSRKAGRAVEHDVDAPPALAAEHAEGGERKAPAARAPSSPADRTGSVARVVGEVLARSRRSRAASRADERQRLVVRGCRGELHARR